MTGAGDHRPSPGRSDGALPSEPVSENGEAPPRRGRLGGGRFGSFGRRPALALALAVPLLLALALVMQFDARANEPKKYDAGEIFRRSAGAVFYIRALNEEGGLKATGTGFVVGKDGTAATAYHVVKGAARVEAVFYDGTKVQAKVAAYDEKADAAALVLPSRKGGYAALPVRETSAGFGEKVFAIGYPMKEEAIITEGIVNNPAAEVNGRDRMLFSAQVASGMSGGPVIDEQGRVAGIISGSFRTIAGIHLGVGAEEMGAVLRKAQKAAAN